MYGSAPFQAPLRIAAYRSMLFSAFPDSKLFGARAVPPQERLAGGHCSPLSGGQTCPVISLDPKATQSRKVLLSVPRLIVWSPSA